MAFSFARVQSSPAGRPGVFESLADVCIVSFVRAKDAGSYRRSGPSLHSVTFVQVSQSDPGHRGATAESSSALASAMQFALSLGSARALVVHPRAAASPAASASAPSVSAFLRNRIFDSYNLGRTAFLGYPADLLGSWRALKSWGTDAVVFSSRFMAWYTELSHSLPELHQSLGVQAVLDFPQLVNFTHINPLVLPAGAAPSLSVAHASVISAVATATAFAAFKLIASR